MNPLTKTATVLLIVMFLAPAAVAAQSFEPSTARSSIGFERARGVSVALELWVPSDGARSRPQLIALSPVSLATGAGSHPSFWRHVLVPGALGGLTGFGIGRLIHSAQDCPAVIPRPPSCSAGHHDGRNILIGIGTGVVAGGLTYLWRRAKR